MKTSLPPATGESVAVMSNVSVFFDDYRICALSHAHLEVRPGEIFGLVGPPGSGKSTALQVLAGRLRPAEGKVRVFGGSPRRSAIKARIGYLPKPAGDTSLSAQWFGVFRQMFAPRKSRLPPSASQAQRLSSLKGAIVGHRDLLVLNQPFFGLDPAARRETAGLLLMLAHRGKTVILGSSSLDETKDLCRRIALLDEGKIQGVGTLDQLLAAPGALRFLAPVLPTATAERVLSVLRQDLAVKAAAAPEAPAAAVTPGADAGTVDRERLAQLTKPARPA
jgi:ABC-2 type transport system ATP-binding protein